MDILKANSIPSETVLTFEVKVNDQKDENIIKNIGQVENTATNEVEHIYRKPIISSKKEVTTQNGLDYVVSNENIEYSLVVENSGSADKDVEIKDLIPEGTTFVDASIKVNGEETDYTEENLKNGIIINVPKKQLKQEQAEDENLTEQEPSEDEDITDQEPSEDEDLTEQEPSEEPGKVVLTFEVIVDELTSDDKTKTIENIAQVDSKDTNKTSIDALPFNMKIEEEIPSFNVNGATQTNTDPKFVKTDIDMRKRSPTPNVTANIKISVTNTGKIEGYAVVETTLPEGFTLASSNWTAKEGNIVTTQTKNIRPGETVELSLSAKWVNSETNMGERNSKSEIVAISNEANVAETTTEDNTSEVNMVIGLVTGEYNDEIIILVIAILGIVSIITEIIIINKYIL